MLTFEIRGERICQTVNIQASAILLEESRFTCCTVGQIIAESQTICWNTLLQSYIELESSIANKAAIFTILETVSSCAGKILIQDEIWQTFNAKLVRVKSQTVVCFTDLIDECKSIKTGCTESFIESATIVSNTKSCKVSEANFTFLALIWKDWNFTVGDNTRSSIL